VKVMIAGNCYIITIIIVIVVVSRTSHSYNIDLSVFLCLVNAGYDPSLHVAVFFLLNSVSPTHRSVPFHASYVAVHSNCRTTAAIPFSFTDKARTSVASCLYLHYE
jgi:hypothetical protein